VEPRTERVWQRLLLFWRATVPGAVVPYSRVYLHDGATQPKFGRRNAIHRIEVKVFRRRRLISDDPPRLFRAFAWNNNSTND
jgi:hypothetical protein